MAFRLFYYPERYPTCEDSDDETVPPKLIQEEVKLHYPDIVCPSKASSISAWQKELIDSFNTEIEQFKQFNREDVINNNAAYKQVDAYLKSNIYNDCWGAYVKKKTGIFGLFNSYAKQKTAVGIQNLYAYDIADEIESLRVCLDKIVENYKDYYNGRLYETQARDCLQQENFIRDILVNFEIDEEFVSFMFGRFKGYGSSPNVTPIAVVVKRKTNEFFEINIYLEE